MWNFKDNYNNEECSVKKVEIKKNTTTLPQRVKKNIKITGILWKIAKLQSQH